MSDRETLLSFGFTTAQVNRALKETKNSGLQPALDWLDQHQDDDFSDEPEKTYSLASVSSDNEAKPVENPISTEKEGGEISAEDLTAQSLQCGMVDDCGKLFKDGSAAEFHAIKTSHQNFSESTNQIKPLTTEEKEAKLAELKERMAIKRAEKLLKEKEEAKENEMKRRRTGKEIIEAKEKQQELEMKLALEQKKKEKMEDKIARDKIKAQIEEDKRERERKRLQEKEGYKQEAVKIAAPVVSNKNYDEARIQVRMPPGIPNLTNTFNANDPLSKVFEFVQSNSNLNSFKFVSTYPKKVYQSEVDSSKSLKELGLTPSSALIVQL
ncbi:hypothetical protein HDU92_004431 [Lobulomyces angularis]|nr:hypothetical protein HDU92_004431 [Lobulomyces angularis]